MPGGSGQLMTQREVVSLSVVSNAPPCAEKS